MAALPGNTPTRTVSNKSRLLIAMVVMATLGASCGCRTASVPTNQTLRSGSTGPAVKAMQTRLSQLGFFVAPDGEYGFNTSHAVMAFQKFYGLGRDSVAGPATLNHINLVGRPDARSRSGRVIEVDLARQVVLLVDGGYVHHVFNASTGDSSHRTPRGSFRIFRQINGLRIAPLGKLWRPKYFNGGIALHGSPSVPSYPASHGCVRLTDPEINFLWGTPWGNIGTTVWVY
ncbi:MAG: L,D-transpeptidase family protein [Microthrixaceae bacterium]